MDIDITAKLFPNPTTMIVQLIATGILVYFFRKFLWKPLQNYLAKRADYIEKNIKEAATMQQEAKTFVEESQKLAQDGALEYREVIEKAKVDAAKVTDSLIAEAQNEAQTKLLQAQRAIEAEKLQAKEEMKKEMVDIAMEAAKKIIGQEIDKKANKALVAEFIDEMSETNE